MAKSWCSSTSCFFFAFACICINHVFSETGGDSYSKHCSTLLPRQPITTRSRGESLPSLSTPYFTGGDSFQRMEPGRSYYYSQRNIRLRLRPDYHQTTAAGVYEVDGSLYVRFPHTPDGAIGNYSRRGYNRRARGGLRFPMNGFWSEKSRKLCMVGSATWKGTDLDAVLKLKFDDEENPTVYTAAVSGSLESTASAGTPAYFDPILIFSFPPSPNYNYSLVSDEANAGFPSRKADSLSLEATEFCSVMERGLRSVELEYAAECRGARPPHGCSPLGGDEYLPRFLSLTPIHCPEGGKKARFLATFQNYSYYNYDSIISLSSTMIGEARWDDKNNRMVGVACRVSNPSLQLGIFIGDCSMRLSLWFPSVLSIRNDAKIAGQMLSSKSVEDSGYFRKINFRSFDEYGAAVVLPEQRYEYTEVDRARKSCTKKQAGKKGNEYPDGQSYDMRFDMNIKNGKGKYVGYAYATPVWVENNSYPNGVSMTATADSDDVVVPVVSELEKRDDTSPVKMSYKIRIQPTIYEVGISSNHTNHTSSPKASLDWPQLNANSGVEITAEGEYDSENGHLCMVGCRKLVSQNSTSAFKDCEVVLEIVVPPLNGKGATAKGVLRSTRPKTDALHFDDLVMESAAYLLGDAERSIWRMDLEIAMVLISGTFFCIFVALQIFHLKRNPEVSSSVSAVMVVLLTVGTIIPLVLNFEAVFLEEHEKKTVQLGAGGKLEANEIAVRVITLVALLLQLRLLQLVYAAKQSDSNGKNLWSEERKAGLISISLYILGCLLTLLLNWIRKTYVHRRYSVWGDLRSYVGLLFDGFLLPQILLNVVRGSAEKALCRWFYLGTSTVRLVPHAYDQYRAHSYPRYEPNSTYYYANPAADMYSTAWDIIIPFGIIAFAVIVFLQQRKGGRCILPQRFRVLEMYDKVPTTENP